MLRKLGLSILIIMCLVLFFSYVAFAKWETSRESDPADLEGHMKAIHFVDEKNGWAAGDYGIIVATRDGGKSWQKLQSPVSSDLWDIHFVNNKTGWASGADGIVLYTTDGGKMWKRQNTLVSVPLYGIYFLDEKKGWTVGTNGTILSTTNAGSTWTLFSGGRGRSRLVGRIFRHPNAWLDSG
jgi:photosystem II stability/assembly factor-like uncharacterized protein